MSQQKLITEGIWPARVIGRATIGIDPTSQPDTDGNRPAIARVNVEITEGPDAGKRMTYEERIGTNNADFVKASLLSVGWKGRTFASVDVDVVEGATTTVEVRHFQIKKGKRTGEFFAKALNLGRGPKPLEEVPLDEMAALDSLIGAMPPPADTDDIPF